MRKLLAPVVLAISLLTGCVLTPVPYYNTNYPVGYYDPALGFWTGVTWDFNFYAYGHPGYGHRWYGPRHYYSYHPR